MRCFYNIDKKKPRNISFAVKALFYISDIQADQFYFSAMNLDNKTYDNILHSLNSFTVS